MAAELFLVKTAVGLVPYEPQDQEAYDELPYGKALRGRFTQARSCPQNRWFHACLQMLFKHQDTWPTFTLFRNAIKRALGLCIVYEVRGKKYYEYPSIAFNKMLQPEFNGICDRFVKLTCERIIPHLEDKEARAMLNLLDADQGKQGYYIAPQQSQRKAG